MEVRPVLTHIGNVGVATIYPFKGMRGILQEELSLRSVSVVGDRRMAFQLAGLNTPPNLLETTRFSGLLRYQPVLADETNPLSELSVLTPTGRLLKAEGHILRREIAKASNKKLTPTPPQLGRGLYHSMPVSLLSEGSATAIDQHLGHTVDRRSYRENLLITVPGNPAYIEDTWVGRIIQFGEGDDGAQVAILKQDRRCGTVNLHPETGEVDPHVFRTIVKEHDGNLGVYATIVREGKIRRDDGIYLVSYEPVILETTN